MNNVKTEVKGTTLTITVDLSPAAIKEARPSASGKTRLLASSGGSIPFAVPGVSSAGLQLNLMIKD